MDYYHKRLGQSDDALTFLERRGLRDEELIQRLRLGVADRTLGYRLPSRNSTAGAELRARLQTLGILRSSGHEHLAGSLVVPIVDPTGKVVDLYGRKVSSKLRGGTAKHLTLGFIRTASWILDPTADDDAVVITTSVLDGLTWWSVGSRRVLIVPTMMLTDEEVSTLLDGQDVARAVFAYPRNQEDQEAVQVVSELLTGRGMSVFKIVFPEGQDANDLHVQGRDLTELLRNAEWIASPPSPRSSPPPTTVVKNAGDHQKWSLSPVTRSSSCRVIAGGGCGAFLGIPALKTCGVNVMVTNDVGLHVDTFDLYSHRYRSGFVKEAASELGVDQKVIKADLGRLLLHLEELQDKAFQEQEGTKNEPPTMSPTQEAAALDLLRDPNLMTRIADDLTNVGLVGEAANKLIVYLAATSRLLQDHSRSSSSPPPEAASPPCSMAS